MGALVGLVASVLIFLGGHTMGQYMREVQPMKLAALEAVWETEQPASFSLLTIGDLTGKQEVWSIRIPYVMSFLACNNFTCEVKGVNELQAQYERAIRSRRLHSADGRHLLDIPHHDGLRLYHDGRIRMVPVCNPPQRL